MNNYLITFNTPDRRIWIRKIVSYRNSIVKDKGKKHTDLIISKQLTTENFQPFHIVLIACLIAYLKKSKSKIKINIIDIELRKFLIEDLQLLKYFNENEDHIETKDKSILNLWKIVNNRTEEHSLNVTKYLERTFFNGYDLSGFKSAIDETYYNIADHSQAEGIAFSYIKYDEQERKINVAACDFGLGIPYTLQAAGKKYEDDSEALRDSLEPGVSAQTLPRNKGFGLDLITDNLSMGGELRIVSNKALLFCQENKVNIETYPLSFDFKGTLIYFEIAIDSFEEKEIIDDTTI